MCKYGELCPNYSEFNGRCIISSPDVDCIPFLIEAYHREKGTEYVKISEMYKKEGLR